MRIGETSAGLRALDRARWQRVVFARALRRSELLKLTPLPGARAVSLGVFRNTPFEFVASALGPFLAFAGLELKLALSAYDDSLSFARSGPSDVDLVWLDFEAYRATMDADRLADWLLARLARLREAGSAPILVANSESPDHEGLNDRIARWAESVPAVRVFDRRAHAVRLGAEYRDHRLAKLGATSLSDAACLALARELGLVWIPAATAPRLKAIVVDLDHTLYEGVLAEDDVSGLVLTPAHRSLQQRLARLAADGMLLGVVSRNEPADVERLFAERKDFPVTPDLLVAVEASWRAKADSLRAIADRLRIGTDAILFVDDNPGELAAVGDALPDTPVLHAADPDETARALDLYPGLARWATTASEADALRARDLAASGERERIARSSADPSQYLRELGVRLLFRMNPAAHAGRLHELSRKTNQFNLALARLAEVDVDRRLSDAGCRTVGVELSDQLSHSGLIAAIFARRDGDDLLVDELCISCRALGRGLEDLIVGHAVNRILGEIPAARVGFSYVAGPRNAPAREWLARFTSLPVSDAGQVALAWDRGEIDARLSALPVEVTWE